MSIYKLILTIVAVFFLAFLPLKAVASRGVSGAIGFWCSEKENGLKNAFAALLDLRCGPLPNSESCERDKAGWHCLIATANCNTVWKSAADPKERWKCVDASAEIKNVSLPVDFGRPEKKASVDICMTHQTKQVLASDAPCDKFTKLSETALVAPTRGRNKTHFFKSLEDAVGQKNETAAFVIPGDIVQIAPMYQLTAWYKFAPPAAVCARYGFDKSKTTEGWIRSEDLRNLLLDPRLLDEQATRALAGAEPPDLSAAYRKTGAGTEVVFRKFSNDTGFIQEWGRSPGIDHQEDVRTYVLGQGWASTKPEAECQQTVYFLNGAVIKMDKAGKCCTGCHGDLDTSGTYLKTKTKVQPQAAALNEDYVAMAKRETKRSVWPNGKTMAEELFLNGDKDGISKYFRDDGTLKEEISFAKGVKSGFDIGYRPDGSVSAYEQFIRGKSYQKWIFDDALKVIAIESDGKSGARSRKNCVVPVAFSNNETTVEMRCAGSIPSS